MLGELVLSQRFNLHIAEVGEEKKPEGGVM
jgi:hypothetical protein